LEQKQTNYYSLRVLFSNAHTMTAESSVSRKWHYYDFPSQEDLDNWRKIKILVAPLGLRDVEFDIITSKES